MSDKLLRSFPDLRCHVGHHVHWRLDSGEFVRRPIVVTTNLPMELAILYEDPGTLVPSRVWKHPSGALTPEVPDVVLAATALAAPRSEVDGFFCEDLRVAGPVPETLGEDVHELGRWETEGRFPAVALAEIDSQGGCDVGGQWIPGALLAEGRAADMKWLEKQGLFKEVPLRECWEATGRKPFDLKLVDKLKIHPDGSTICRSRLVVREIKAAKSQSQRLSEAEVFASMPPNEALKLLISAMASGPYAGTEKLVLAVFDVSRAHFYGVSRRRVYVEMPDGWKSPGYCGVLLKTMYGTQDAAQVWHETWSGHLEASGIAVGVATPSLFCGRNGTIRGLCHGDDFVVVCSSKVVDDFENLLEERSELKQCGILKTIVGVTSRRHALY